MPNINTKFTLSGEKEYKQAISEIGSGMSPEEPPPHWPPPPVEPPPL